MSTLHVVCSELFGGKSTHFTKILASLKGWKTLFSTQSHIGKGVKTWRHVSCSFLTHGILVVHSSLGLVRSSPGGMAEHDVNRLTKQYICRSVWVVLEVQCKHIWHTWSLWGIMQGFDQSFFTRPSPVLAFFVTAGFARPHTPRMSNLHALAVWSCEELTGQNK